VNALAAALLGVAALCVERSTRTVSREDARRRTRSERATPTSDPPSRRIDLRTACIAIFTAVAGYAVAGPLGAAAGPALSIAVRRLGRVRSRRALAARRDEQLADAVAALTAAVRSGMSVPQAIAYAMREAEAPVADDLARMVADIDVGVPLVDAVDRWARRTGGEDVQLVAGALDLHRRSGGDLPTVLDQVASTIRERVAVGREIRALTAQARLSGWILGVLPVGFFAFLWLTSRRDIQGALTTPAGLWSVLLGLALEVGAFFWIRSLLDVS
jgi:tight adherence protein B